MIWIVLGYVILVFLNSSVNLMVFRITTLMTVHISLSFRWLCNLSVTLNKRRLNSKEISKLLFKMDWIIKLPSLLWTLKMKPKNPIHVTMIVYYLILNSFLKQTWHIVSFKSIALLHSLGRRLVEHVHRHFILLFFFLIKLI